MKRFINPVPQFLKSNGDLCSAGKVYFLQEGTDVLTSTKAIYLDPEGATQSINPVPLSNEGRMPNVFGEGKYRAKLYDSANVLQWTRDIDFDAESAQFEEWNSQVTYEEKAITQGSDGDYYISEVPSNKGNDPTVGASAQYWSKIALIEFFNADKPGGYPDNAVVILNGRLYASNTANNTNTPPHATWDDLSFNNTVIGDFTAGTIQLQNSSSVDPLKLDWYEEGSWTPVVSGAVSAGSASYTQQLGKFTKIGNVVFYSATVAYSGHTGTGVMYVSGPSFAPTGTQKNIAMISYITLAVGAGLEATAESDSNGAGGARFFVASNDPASGIRSVLNIDAECSMYITGFFFTA